MIISFNSVDNDRFNNELIMLHDESFFSKTKRRQKEDFLYRL